MTTPFNALFLERVGDDVQPRVISAGTVLAPFLSSKNTDIITVRQLIKAEVCDSYGKALERKEGFLNLRQRQRNQDAAPR